MTGMLRIKQLETHLVLVLALGIVYYFTSQRVYLFAAGMIGLIGLFIPWLAAHIHHLWMKLAHLLGFVMSKVLLTLVFFIVVLPMSIFSRLFGNKTGIRLRPRESSYYVVRDFTYTKESIEQVW